MFLKHVDVRLFRASCCSCVCICPRFVQDKFGLRPLKMPSNPHNPRSPIFNNPRSHRRATTFGYVKILYLCLEWTVWAFFCTRVQEQTMQLHHSLLYRWAGHFCNAVLLLSTKWSKATFIVPQFRRKSGAGLVSVLAQRCITPQIFIGLGNITSLNQ